MKNKLFNILCGLKSTQQNFAQRSQSSQRLRKYFLVLCFFLIINFISAQEYFYPLNRDMETRIESFINEDSTGFHTSMKPYINSELKKIAPIDSVWQPIVGDSKFYKTWTGRKLREEH